MRNAGLRVGKSPRVTRMRRLLRCLTMSLESRSVGKAVRAGFQDLSPYEPDKNRCRRRAPMWPLLDEGLFSWFKRYVFAIEFECV